MFLIYKILTFNHSAFWGKGVRVLGIHIWKQLSDSLMTESCLERQEGSLNDSFQPKWMFKLKLSKNDE